VVSDFRECHSMLYLKTLFLKYKFNLVPVIINMPKIFNFCL